MFTVTPPDGESAAPTTGAPTLVRNEDMWIGTFPGLGMVQVAPDGQFTVTPANADHTESTGGEDDVEERRRALVHGWAELLALVRRGHRLTPGASLCPPDDPRTLLLTGDPHDVIIVLLELSRRGWLVLSDFPAPTTWAADQLVAHPRRAPLLMSARRAEKAHVSGTPIRRDSDAIVVALPRSEQPLPVAALAAVRTRKTGEPVFEELTGHSRFEAATRIFFGGVLQSEDQQAGAAALAEHLALAKLPSARIGLDPSKPAPDAGAANQSHHPHAASIDTLLAWWDRSKVRP